MIDFDELRKEVAIKHSVLLGENDPILVTVTLNDLVLGRYVEVLTAQGEGHVMALSAALQDHIELSKETGGRIITEAADYVSAEVHKAVSSAVADASAAIRQDIANAQAANREAVGGVEAARTARATAIIAAVVAGFCAVIAVAALAVVLIR